MVREPGLVRGAKKKMLLMIGVIVVFRKWTVK